MTTWPHFAEDEIAAATNVLRSAKVNYWTGKEGINFEKEFAQYIGVKHAIALSNGTVALELALMALGIGEGDEVIVPCRTFIATASCVVARRAKPVVADIDLTSQNITAEIIEPLITAKTKAIIVVHLAGWPCEMEAILALAKRHNLYVVEDCAQAHGATYDGKKVGSLGDIGAFSFCQDKIMTTAGEGGMITTNNDALWERIWSYKDHGKSYAKIQANVFNVGFRWLHDSFGSNERMSEVQSAVGRLQLQKLDQWLVARKRNAHIWDEGLSDCSNVRVAIPPNYVSHAYYKYSFFIKPEHLKAGWTRDKILEAINAKGVPCFTGGCPEIYREQAFLKANYGYTEDFYLPNARQLGQTSLMVLVHPTLAVADIQQSLESVKAVLYEAQG
ncbi:MAG: DegT/DnrJ/EryC1/StrS aminotransferase family protein [Gammaproteobacteria bacterium]|nr:DegT/DnrJ/EryC1/StrS aminotransferase family protein [Gammaproteobacteria bacterium]